MVRDLTDLGSIRVLPVPHHKRRRVIEIVSTGRRTAMPKALARVLVERAPEPKPEPKPKDEDEF